VDQSAPEFDSIGIDQADAIASAKIAFHLPDSRGEQAPALAAQRFGRAPVNRESARRTQGESDPMLAAFEPFASRDDERAAFAAGVQNRLQDSALASRRDDGGYSGARGLPRG